MVKELPGDLGGLGLALGCVLEQVFQVFEYLSPDLSSI